MTVVYHRSRADRVADNAARHRVAVYIRQNNHAESSVDRQEAALRAYLSDHPEWRVVATYRDTTPAASHRAYRPGLEHALRAACSGEYDTLIVHSIDRLSRRLDDVAAILGNLTGAAVTVRSVSESFDTSTPAGRIVAQSLAVVAGYHREIEHHVREHTHNASLARGHRFHGPLLAGMTSARRWRHYRIGRRPS